MATLVTTDVQGSEHSTVSWGAVIGGGIMAAALALFLAALGVGLGLLSRPGVTKGYPPQPLA
jgi:high-affinity Fe2+/Pb2+ permease